MDLCQLLHHGTHYRLGCISAVGVFLTHGPPKIHMHGWVCEHRHTVPNGSGLAGA